MKKIFYIILLLIGASCGNDEVTENNEVNEDYSKDNQDTTETAELIELQVEYGEILENDYEENEILIFEGYVGLIPSRVNYYDNKMFVTITERRFQEAGELIQLKMPLGTSKNNVKELPGNYTQSDFEIVTENDSIVGVAEKVRIHAKRDAYSSSKNYLTLVSIAAVQADFDTEIFDQAVPLSNEVIADSTQNIVYSYIEGYLSVPVIIIPTDNRTRLDFKNKTNNKIDNVNVLVDPGPSAMDTLPKSYKPSDLKIRDYKGKLIKNGAKVRLYGTWKRYAHKPSSGTPGSFNLEEIVKL